MAGAIWAVGELADGGPTRLTLELATLAGRLGAAAGAEAATVLIGEGAVAAAEEVAKHGTDVLAVEVSPGERPWSAVAAPRVAALAAERGAALLLVGASNDGRDLAGLLVGSGDWPALVNTSGVEWQEGGPVVAMSTWGGRLVTRSAFVDGSGIVVVRPGSVTAEATAKPGRVERLEPPSVEELPEVRVVGRAEESAGAASIDDARIIVAGGRGVGSPDGFALVGEIAEALGGAVGATRAAVDSGWIPYAQQIGQTGKIVKPKLYLAMGISGAIQHKVGMQTSETIIAVNRDPDAPIAEFADLLVIGDLFEVGRAVVDQLKARRS